MLSLTDYLIDDGTECNSSSDLLLERNREQCLVDLLVPSLVFLITILQKLQVCCIFNIFNTLEGSCDIAATFIYYWLVSTGDAMLSI